MISTATRKGRDFVKKMEYQQVKERVQRESAALGGIVIRTGLGMLAALLVWIFLAR